MGRSKPQTGAPTAPLTPQPHPPAWFRVVRWTVFSATIALAIGMLALLDQQLTSIKWQYDGPLKEYQGRDIRVVYCMFASSTDDSMEGRCRFGFAVPSASIALSLIWGYMQSLRRNPFRHPSARLADLVLCGTWALFWLAAAVVFCVWADAANKVGSFLQPARDARNGFCVMAWLEFLFVGLLTATAGLLFSPKCQQVFEKWDAKSKQKKAAKEQKRLHSQQEAAQQQDAAAATAAAATKQQQAAAAHTCHPRPADAAAGPAAGAAPMPAACRAGAAGHATPEPTGVPVSTHAAADAATDRVGAAPTAATGADNPFR